jgi:uncharacterized protein (DUF983 family)
MTDLHTCKQCGHRYDENHTFVQTTHCCPKCGVNIGRTDKAGLPYYRIFVPVILGMIILAVIMMTQSLL